MSIQETSFNEFDRIKETFYPVHIFVFCNSSDAIDELSIVGEDVLDVSEGVSRNFRCVQCFVNNDVFCC